MSGRNAGKTPGRGPKAAPGCHSITKFFKRVDSKVVVGPAGSEAATPSVSTAAKPAGGGAGLECTPNARRQSLGGEPTSQKRKAEGEAENTGTPRAAPGSTAKRCASTGPATGGGRAMPYQAAAAADGTSLLAAFSQAEADLGSPGLAQRPQHSAPLVLMAEQHAAKLAQLEEEHSATLEQQAEQQAGQHAAELAQLEGVQTAALAQKAEQHAGEHTQLKEEHSAALAQHAEEHAGQHAGGLTRLEEVQADALAQQAKQHAGELTQLKEVQTAALAQQAEQHAAELSQLEEEKTAALAQQAQRHAERIQQFAALQEAEASLRKQLAAAQGQLAAEGSRSVQLEQQLASAEGRLADLQQVAASRIAEIDLMLAAARQQLAAAESRLVGEQQAAREQVAKLERQLEAVQGELSRAQQAVKVQAAELEGRLASERQHREAAEREAEQLRQRCKDLQARVVGLQADMAHLAEQQAAAASQASSWQQHAEEAAAQVAALQQQLEAAQASAAGAAAASSEGTQLTEQVRELSEELQKLRDRHNTLKKELATEQGCRAEAAVAARLREERLQRLCDDVARQLALARREKADLQLQLDARQQGGGAGPSRGKLQACVGSSRQRGSGLPSGKRAAAAPADAPSFRDGNREAIRAAICSLGEVKSNERGSVVGRAQAALAAQGVKASEEEILVVRLELDQTVKLTNKGNEWVYCYSQAQS